MNAPNDLTQIWAKTTNVKVDGSLLFLQVKSPEMPASYLTNDVWFAMCRRIKPGLWNVGIRHAALQDVKGVHEAAARGILAKVNISSANNVGFSLPDEQQPKRFSPR